MIGYIYHIINKVNGKHYIGQTVDVKRRKQAHILKLNKGLHPNIDLQNDWNLFSEKEFDFIYKEVEYATEEDLNQLEINEIAAYDSFNNGYNRNEGGNRKYWNSSKVLNYEDYKLIYYGCQWQGMTTIISKKFNVDSSTVSSILRNVSYQDYYCRSQEELTKEDIDNLKLEFRKCFDIPLDKPEDESRIPSHLSEEEYFYCLCIASTYGRGIETALGKFFGKHKSFLSNGLKNKTRGKVKEAQERLCELTCEEVQEIGEQKFTEWKIDEYSNIPIKKQYSDRWRY